MGVQNLWPLLSPVARPVSLETMSDKRLAVDASIWLYQFQMAMRDSAGEALAGAHVVGSFRRITKLLFHGIKPIFVFDGKAPMLKRRIISERRARKEGAATSHQRTAKQLLSARLRAIAAGRLLEQKSRSNKIARAKQGDKIDVENVTYYDDLPTGDIDLNPSQNSNKENSDNSKPKRKNLQDEYALPYLNKPLPTSSISDLRLAEPGFENPTRAEKDKVTKRRTRSSYGEEVTEESRPLSSIAQGLDLSDILDSLSNPTAAGNSQALPSLKKLLRNPIFLSLASEDQFELLSDLRIRSRQVNHHRVEEMRKSKTMEEFSKRQIGNLEVRNRLTMGVMGVLGMETDGSLDDVLPEAGRSRKRVVASRNKEYMLQRTATGWTLAKENPKSQLIVISEEEEDSDKNDLTEFSPEDKESTTHKPTLFELDEDDPESHIKAQEIIDQEIDFELQEAIFRTLQDAPKQNLETKIIHPSILNNLESDEESLDYVDIEESHQPSDFHIEEVKIKLHDVGEAAARFLTGKNAQDSESENDEFEEVVINTPGLSTESPTLLSTNVPNFQVQEVKISLDNVGEAAARFLTRKEQKIQSESEDGDFEEVVIDASSALGVMQPKQGISPSIVLTSVPVQQPIKQNLTVQGNNLLRNQIQDQTQNQAQDQTLDKNNDQLIRAKNMLARFPNKPFKVSLLDSVLAGSDSDSDLETRHSVKPSVKTVPMTSNDAVEEPVTLEIASDTSSEIWVRPEKAVKVPPVSTDLSEVEFVEAADTTPSESAEMRKENRLEKEEEVPLGLTDLSEVEFVAPGDQTVPAEVIDISREKTPERDLTPIDWSPSPPSIVNKNPLFQPLSDDDEGNLSDKNLIEDTEIVDEDIIEDLITLEEEEVLRKRNAEREQQEKEAAEMIESENRESLQLIRGEAENEARRLAVERNKESRNADGISQQMVNDIKDLLQLFGIPWVDAPEEAEAECAALLSKNLVDGIITDDSDVFLFGGYRIYRNMFNQTKIVECFLLSDIENELGLDRRKLVDLAYLLGSDYTEGLGGIGPVLARELLEEFKGKTLEEFKEWWVKVQNGMDTPEDTNTIWKRKFKRSHKNLVLEDSWPHPSVRKSYMTPTVTTSTESFSWAGPDLDGIRTFLTKTLNWTTQKTDEVMLPLLKRQNDRKKGKIAVQKNLGDYFDVSLGNGPLSAHHKAAYKSTRLQTILKNWRNRERNTENDQTEPVPKSKRKTPKRKAVTRKKAPKVVSCSTSQSEKIGSSESSEERLSRKRHKSRK